MLYTELQSAVHAMIQRLEYSFTFNPSLLTIPKRKQQVAEILEEAEKYIWRISTTSNIYTHLDFSSKVSSANAIVNIFPENTKV